MNLDLLLLGNDAGAVVVIDAVVNIGVAGATFIMGSGRGALVLIIFPAALLSCCDVEFKAVWMALSPPTDP